MFGDIAGAADDVGKGDIARAVEDEVGVVGDITGDGAGSVAVAERESARGNRGAASIGVVGGQNESACSDLVHPADASDVAGEGGAIGAVENKSTGIFDVADH